MKVKELLDELNLTLLTKDVSEDALYAEVKGGSNFNGDISKWNVSNVRNMKAVFDNCPIEEKYKPKFKK